MKNNEDALNAFIGKIAEASEKAGTLSDFIQNHLGYSPEEVNWGHVGDAGHVLEQLDEILNFLGINKGAENE
ncbi:MAG: hypothetical protein FWH12_06375 [Treponema sp.]|nr:hypothetical protein [Treponema sp.]